MTGRSKLAAWAVHGFTASGAVLALLALDSAIAERPREALLWLFAAMVVDGLDGSLARIARVKERLPRIDGESLDLVIDYMTWVLIPALLIWRSGILPAGLGLPLAAAILISSLYVFARRDMKSEDGYFRGFPALWNVVAFYFFAAPPPGWATAAIVAALVLLTFAPIHVVHPLRVRDYGAWLPAVAAAWALTTLALFFPQLGEDALRLSLAVSLGSAALLLAMGLWRSARGLRRASS